MQDDIAKLILRLTVGGLLLAHGADKLMNGIGAIKIVVVEHGLPEACAYAVYLGEVAGPVLVVLGLFARVGAGLIVADMLAAIWLVHVRNLAMIAPGGGYALESEALFLLGAVCVALLGAGRLSVGGGRWN